jgi:WD40 repeat protein
MKNSLFRAHEKSNNSWDVSLVSSVDCYLKSKVQGKMLRFDRNRNYLFWKSSDSEITRINVKTGHRRLFKCKFKRPYDFITDFKSNKEGDKLCVLSRYGNVIIFVIQNLDGYRTVVKQFYDKRKQFFLKISKLIFSDFGLDNPVFTSLAFSSNGKRLVASSYDLVSETERKIELFVLRVDYNQLKIQTKYTMNYSIPVEPLDMIKHLDFLDIDKKRKVLMTVGLNQGNMCLLSTKSKSLELFTEEIPIG